MRRKHAAEVGFSLEEDIRSLVLPFVHFVIYLVYHHIRFISLLSYQIVVASFQHYLFV